MKHSTFEKLIYEHFDALQTTIMSFKSVTFNCICDLALILRSYITGPNLWNQLLGTMRNLLSHKYLKHILEFSCLGLAGLLW